MPYERLASLSSCQIDFSCVLRYESRREWFIPAPCLCDNAAQFLNCLPFVGFFVYFARWIFSKPSWQSGTTFACRHADWFGIYLLPLLFIFIVFHSFLISFLLSLILSFLLLFLIYSFFIFVLSHHFLLPSFLKRILCSFFLLLFSFFSSYFLTSSLISLFLSYFPSLLLFFSFLSFYFCPTSFPLHFSLSISLILYFLLL
jgi:hypothetical protein